MNRKPIAAGTFYESTFDKLEKQITSCFTHKLGPGDLPVKRTNKKILSIITPHAGYFYSGPCMAWAYKEIAESKFPKTYIIIAPNHTGLGSEFSTYLFADWETPFGIIKVDKNLGNKLIKKFPDLTNEAEAHLQEHSIEVQLPFLQFASKDNLNKLQFLPICISSTDYNKLIKLGKILSEFQDIVLICSSDFTHYGPNYGFLPFLYSKKENIYDLDSKAISYIKELNSKDFYEFSKTTTICGRSPITATIEFSKLKKSKKVTLLSYYTSGDIINNYENAVGYASLVFK